MRVVITGGIGFLGRKLCWPNAFDTPRALRLGFKADESIDAIVRGFVEDELTPSVAPPSGGSR